MSHPFGVSCAVLCLGLSVASCDTQPTEPPQQTGLKPVPLPEAARSFVVFFELWSTDLNSDAKAIIAAALVAARDNSLPVTVTGYADPEGSAAQNEALSADRAKAVADALIAGGIAAGRVTQNSVGSVGYIADAQEARRVVIAIGEVSPTKN